MTETTFFEPSEERTVCLLFDSMVEITDDYHSTEENFADKIDEEKRKIWVSKEMLSMASPVFKTMFYGKFCENRENSLNQKPIYLPSKKLNDFLILLECLSPNVDRKEVDQSNVRVIFPLAHEYQIQLLISKCVECFKDGLSKIGIGNESILDDVPFFAKYALTSLVTYIIPYAAALDVEIIDKYRKENTEKLSADHPFYFAVYEAKAHRLSLEKQFKHQSYKKNSPPSPYEENSPFRTRMITGFHNCGRNGKIACLCGYEFAEELLHL